MAGIPALNIDGCTLEGPCGVCATLTPAARATLAERLVDEPSQAPALVLRIWADHLSEQVSVVRSATLAFTDAPAGLWRNICATGVEVELAKLAGLILAAPAGVDLVDTSTATSEARTALAEALSQS